MPRSANDLVYGGLHGEDYASVNECTQHSCLLGQYGLGRLSEAMLAILAYMGGPLPPPRMMEEDAEVDEDVASVMEGADGDPEQIRENVSDGGTPLPADLAGWRWATAGLALWPRLWKSDTPPASAESTDRHRAMERFTLWPFRRASES